MTVPRVSRIASKLLRVAAIGLGALGGAIIICLVWQNWLFEQQQEDAKIINISGRQRMLSQRLLSKAILLRDTKDTLQLPLQMQQLLQEWKSAHAILNNQKQNISSNTNNIRATLDSLFNTIDNSRLPLLNLYNEIVQNPTEIEQKVQEVIVISEDFLQTMEHITLAFERVAKEHVTNQKMATLVSAIVLVLCVVTILGVFVVPVVRTLDTEEQRFIQAIIETEERERARISQDLHDDVGHQMALLTLNVSSFLCKPEDEEKRQHILESLCNISKAVRGISQAMSPTGLVNFGLIATLAEEARRTSTLVHCTFQAHVQQQRFSHDVELCIYRVTQELLANVIKHARATAIDIQLVQHQNVLTLTVEDNGEGFDYPDGTITGMGLLGLHTRVMPLYGKVSIDSNLGRGTHVTVEIPIHTTKQPQMEIA